MTTEKARQNLIDSIMKLDESDPYRQSLAVIAQAHENGELNDIEAYVLTNNILVNYDFNVVIPYKQKIIEEQRKQESEKSEELLSNIPIQNPEDVTEVAIKTKTEIGQIFLNGFNDCYRTIGVKKS